MRRRRVMFGRPAIRRIACRHHPPRDDRLRRRAFRLRGAVPVLLPGVGG
jgi:hypothetical protein